MALCDVLEKRGELGIRGAFFEAGLEVSIEDEPEIARMGAIENDRHPDFAAPEGEAPRHDSDQGGGRVVEKKGFAKDGGILAKAFDPHFVAEDENGRGAGLGIRWQDSAAEQGRNAEELEGIAGNQVGVERFWRGGLAEHCT